MPVSSDLRTFPTIISPRKGWKTTILNTTWMCTPEKGKRIVQMDDHHTCKGERPCNHSRPSPLCTKPSLRLSIRCTHTHRPCPSSTLLLYLRGHGSRKGVHPSQQSFEDSNCARAGNRRNKDSNRTSRQHLTYFLCRWSWIVLEMSCGGKRSSSL